MVPMHESIGTHDCFVIVSPSFFFVFYRCEIKQTEPDETKLHICKDIGFDCIVRFVI